MKTIIIMILALVAILYVAGLEVTFKPFSIKFNNLLGAFGMIFLILALVCMGLEDYKRGYKKGNLDGYKQGSREMRDAVIEFVNKLPTKSEDNEKDNNTK